LGAGGNWDDLRAHADRTGRDLRLVARVEEIRLARAIRVGEVDTFARARDDYALAFTAAGLGGEGDEPAAVADRIATSPARAALVAALDDWASYPGNTKRLEWLLAVARRADARSSPWSDRVRSVKTWNDRAALEEQAADAPADDPDEGVALLVNLGIRLSRAHGDGVRLLRRVQRAHPGDFWANHGLADVLRDAKQYPEAVRYYRAAVALRPDAQTGRANLGLALALAGRYDDAAAEYRQATKIDPTVFEAWSNLGFALTMQRKNAEAVGAYERAVALRPDDAVNHSKYGFSLAALGRHADAEQQYRRVLELKPGYKPALIGLREEIISQGRHGEALDRWRETLDADPPNHADWYGYAELCIFVGRADEYARIRDRMLEKFGDTADPYVAERVARACLLAPGTPDEGRRAAALADKAAATDRAKVPASVITHFMFTKALAEYRQGKYESAATILQGAVGHVLGPAPGLVKAMAEHRLGRWAAARQTRDAAVAAYDWTSTKARTLEDWIYHVLRRETDALLGASDDDKAA
jgi:serine/threonine-protein kinase